MKKIYIFAFLLTAVVLILIAEKSNLKLLPIRNENLILNGDFCNGLDYWEYDNNINIIKTNNINYARVQCEGKKQVRLWQNVNVVSGQTYKLSFSLNGQQKGAFAIFLDSSTFKESYFFCKGKVGANNYEWEIKPNKGGIYQVFLSSNLEGIFNYSNVSFTKVDSRSVRIFKIVISIFILFLLFVFIYLIKYNFFYVFLLLFLMILPVIYTEKNDKSDFENRNLANYRSFIHNSKINKNYGIDFNNWLNDRFWIRNFVLLYYNSLNWYINKRIDNKFVLSGKDKWLFLKSNVKKIHRPLKYYDDAYDKTLNNILKLKDFCEKEGSDLYILIAPYSEEIYSSKLIGVNLDEKLGALDSSINRLKADAGINILYAYKALNDVKSSGLVFYKTDHHWTPFGAYNAYLVLMNEIIKKHKAIILPDKAFNIYERSLKYEFGETYRRINNISKSARRSLFPISDKYKYYKINNSFFTNMFYDEHNNSDIKSKEKIFIFGDSFVNNISPFFNYSFPNTKSFVKPLQIYMPNIENMINKYKPNITVMIIYSSNFELIKNWYGNTNY